MIVIELIYKKPLVEVDSLLKPHRAFLQKCYDKGLLLASGSKIPRDGGIVIALVDKETMIKVMKEDPFYQNGIADYRFIQFEPNKYCKELEMLLKK